MPLPKLGLLVSIQPDRQVLRWETGLIEVKVHPTGYNLASLEGDLIALQLDSNHASSERCLFRFNEGHAHLNLIFFIYYLIKQLQL